MNLIHVTSVSPVTIGQLKINVSYEENYLVPALHPGKASNPTHISHFLCEIALETGMQTCAVVARQSLQL
jgi:hypothetical protein